MERFNALYPNKPDFCRLIDNYVNYADDLIIKFETEPDFQIAVSVDMLDTGIDVPSVLNLVFFKPVKSYIKFVQMIGRGTRLCKDIFGPGKDKTQFLIFDWCHNFEYFSIPAHTQQGGKTVISLTQRLFEMRLDILQELQHIEHQENSFNKAYHGRLKELLHKAIETVKGNSARISVRQKMSYLDKYTDVTVWQCISPVMGKEIKLHIAPLVDDADQGNQYSKAFDCKMLNIELSLLVNGTVAGAESNVTTVRMLAKFLLTKASIPQIMEKAARLKEAESEQFWLNPTIEKLECLREDLRDLMKFLDDSSNILYLTDFHDEEVEIPGSGTGIFDIRTYKEKSLTILPSMEIIPLSIKLKLGAIESFGS